MRMSRNSVTFRNSFMLETFDHVLPAGTYELSTMDEEVQTDAGRIWRRISTMLCTPSIEQQSGSQYWTHIYPSDLENALKLDSQTCTS